MSVENPEVADNVDNFKKPLNGGLNGISNGHPVKDSERSSSSSSKSGDDKHRSSSSSSHKSSSKDKYRDKDRDRDKDRSSSSSSSNRDKDRSKHSSSSSHSSSKDKSSSSSHKSSSRDKERDKDKERSKDKEDRDKDKNREKDRDKDKERSKHRDREDKDKERSKDKDKERSKDKDRDKYKSSSSSSKDKSSSSSSSHRDKDRDKDKHKSSSSSSSKDKHSSSSHKSKDRDKNRDRSSSSKNKEKRDDDKIKEENEIKTENNITSNNEKISSDDLIKVEKYEIKQDEESCYDYNGSIDTNNICNTKSEVVKHEISFNTSHASSCDYSLSQFDKNEENFYVKEEAPAEDEDEESQDPLRQGSDDEEEEDDDVPLAKRRKVVSDEEDEDDDIPLISRKKTPAAPKVAQKKKKKVSDDEEYSDYDEPPKKKKVKKEKKEKVVVKNEKPTPVKTETVSPVKGGRKKKEEEQQEVWKWWEEEKRDDNVKWTFLEHKGPMFAKPYEPLPSHVKFYYDGKEMKLSEPAEEIATFYARMLDHDYTSKKIFNDNFFKDWRKSMTSKEKDKITRLEKCNFKDMAIYFKEKSEQNKNKTKEQKEALKKENEEIMNEYGYCIIDGHKEKIGNFKIEPPGLFRGRGEHPKMGCLKRRVVPEDVMINCSKDSKFPEPPKGHRWKEIRHDNTVTWLASWQENVQGQVKYVMLNPSSKLKGEKDYAKYETARRLHKCIDKIRSTYRDEWKSKEMRIRQRAVALYFIDKLALRAGNEKDEDQADTVGCCSLRVEHIELHKEKDGKENLVVFDFLGKDSIRYYNEVEVEKRVFKNLELFKENKKEGDDLFDRLNTSVLNEHLRDLMEGLTAKVFRTYNASITLQRQLDELTDPDSTIPEKLLSYNRANRAVAILCNHQRAVPKTHGKSMENLKSKINTKREQVDECEAEVKDLQKAAKRGSVKDKIALDKKKKMLERLKEQLKKLELQETDRDENKTIALGTSKLNYLDPRISVAWCKKYNVPIEKIFNKTQRDKFRWAIDMADENYSFIK